MGLRVAENIMYYVVVTFSITYLKTVHDFDVTTVLGLLILAHAFHFVVIPFYGRLSDTIGRRPVYMAGAVLSGVWAFVAFPMFDTQNPIIILAAIFLGLGVHGLMYAGQPAIMAEMFPTRMRYSGVSLGYQVTSIFAGSLAPIIASTLLKDFGHWLPVALYLVIASIITIVAVYFARETKGASLRDLDRADIAAQTESEVRTQA